MKAIAVHPRKREVGLIHCEAPRITKPTEVMLRMLDVGVCGTDREICAFQYGTPPAGSEHLIIGHESLGQVVEVGSAVSRLSPGDLVVTMVRRPCPHDHCRACRSERQDFCYTGDFTERGIKGAHGFMTELVVDEECYMHHVPAKLRDVAILVEPLTIGEKALAQIWQVQERLPWACASAARKNRGSCHSALILGAGPVGLLGAMAFAAAGFNTHVYSRDPAGGPKARVIEAIGGTFISADECPVTSLPERLGGIDVVYEAAGASKASFELLKELGTNGIFCFTGVPGRKGPVEVDTDLIMRNLVLKNQVVFGTVNAGHEAFAAAIKDLGSFMKHWPDAVRSLITGRHPVDSYRDLLLGPAAGIKNVIAFA